MNHSRNGIAGFRLTENTWITELGNWIDAISPDGRRAGALLFDTRIIDLPGVRDRVVSAVLTDRRLVLGGMTGLIPVADVVAAGEQVWLLTAQAVTPTLSSLLGAGTVDAGGAASVLAETAHTLVALHAAGVTHGSVHPGTVVITAEGAALLSERGLADAIRGQISAPDRDTSGWAALARALAAACARDAPQAAALFERAAATASTHGPAAARRTLLAGRDVLPGGVISRERLARAARGQSVFAQPPAYNRPDGGGSRGRHEDRDEGDIVTLLAVPGSTPGGAFPGTNAAPGTNPAPGAFPPATEGQRERGSQGPTQLSPGRAGTDASAEMRFGPGVSAETPVERLWRDGAAAGRSAANRRTRASRARRRRTILSAMLFAIIMACAVVAWLRLGTAPELAISSVTVTGPKKTQRCDSVAFVTGTIVTNGGIGEISYEWRNNLSKRVDRSTLRTTSGKTSYNVSYNWLLEGKRSTKATATLRVLSPGAVRTEKTSFGYRC